MVIGRAPMLASFSAYTRGVIVPCMAWRRPSLRALASFESHRERRFAFFTTDLKTTRRNARFSFGGRGSARKSAPHGLSVRSETAIAWVGVYSFQIAK
jgi:hypothetical protein